MSTHIRRVLLHLEDGRDWELKLEPPVNRVIPVGHSHLRALWAAYGEV